MAKQYYTLEEAADVLGMSADEVNELISQGKFKSQEQEGRPVLLIEDVERFVANEGSSVVDLTIGEGSPALAQVADDAAPGLTSDINLLGLDESSADLDLGLSPSDPRSETPAPAPAPSKPAAGRSADELIESGGLALTEPSDIDLTALDEAAHDTGLSASDVIALDEPQRAGPAGSAAGRSGSSVAVLDDASLRSETDPLAKTRIAPVSDADLALESVGSGSGLLDLPRESDDTSLGAELLDVISPSEGSETETQSETIDSDTGTVDAQLAVTEESSDVAAVVEDEGSPAAIETVYRPTAVALAADPMAPAFTGLAVSATVFLLVTGLAATSQIQGVWPAFMRFVDSGANLYIFAGAAAGLTALAWVVGWLIGRSAGVPRKPRPPKPAKPAKPSKKDKAKAAAE